MDSLRFYRKASAAVLHRNYSTKCDSTPMTNPGRCQFAGCDIEPNSLKS